jgi:hypothetical protein
MKTRSVLVGSSVLVALLAACYKKSDYSPTAPLANQVITLSSPSGVTSLPADGFSRLHLEARLPGDPAFVNRTVVFSATGGATLDGGTVGANCNNLCRNVTADGNGIARIDLISASQVGTAVVTAAPAGASGIIASLSINFVAASPDDTIRFVTAPSRAPADGAMLTTYTVAISPSLPTGSRKVTFQTTAPGTSFAGGTGQSIQVDTGAGGQASADLKSPLTITTGRVSATVSGVTREVAVSFDRALPTSISVQADLPVAAAAAGTKIHVTATLRHDQGFASDGTAVTFQATRGDTPVGIFTNVTLTTNGVATADFLPNTTTGGVVTLTVGAQGTQLTGSTQILLTGSGS